MKPFKDIINNPINESFPEVQNFGNPSNKPIETTTVIQWSNDEPVQWSDSQNVEA